MSGWQTCGKPADCLGNPNWQHIYFLKSNNHLKAQTTLLFLDDEYLYLTQLVDTSSFNPANPFYVDHTHEFFSFPDGNPSKSFSQIALTDPDVLVHPQSNYFDSTYLGGWIDGNMVDIVKITSYTPATHTITFEKMSKVPYENGNSYSL